MTRFFAAIERGLREFDSSDHCPRFAIHLKNAPLENADLYLIFRNDLRNYAVFQFVPVSPKTLKLSIQERKLTPDRKILWSPVAEKRQNQPVFAGSLNTQDVVCLWLNEAFVWKVMFLGFLSVIYVISVSPKIPPPPDAHRISGFVNAESCADQQLYVIKWEWNYFHNPIFSISSEQYRKKLAVKTVINHRITNQ